MAYVSVEDLKLYAGIDSTADDAVLRSLVTQAQALFETVTGRVFEAAADSTRYFDAVADVDGLTLVLDRDLCAITSITNGDGVAVTALQYVKEPRNGTPWYAIKLKASSGVAWTYGDDPENAIAIAGKWAWSTTAPEDVQWAVTRLAAYLYRQRDSAGGEGDRPVMSPSGAVLLPGKLPDDVMTVVRRYKRTL